MVEQAISGAVALFISPDGHVVAHAADFDRSKPAGFDLFDAQSHRARDRLSHAACHEMMNANAAESIGQYAADRLLEEMRRKKGYRIEVLQVVVPTPEDSS